MTNIDKKREDFEAWVDAKVFCVVGSDAVISVDDIREYFNAKKHSGEEVAWLYDKKDYQSDGINRDGGNCTCHQCCGEIEVVIKDFVTTDADEYDDENCFNIRPLYLSPQQPQEVAEMLEKVARICEELSAENGVKYELSKNHYYEGASDALDIASQTIRNLINQPTKQESGGK